MTCRLLATMSYLLNEFYLADCLADRDPELHFTQKQTRLSLHRRPPASLINQPCARGACKHAHNNQKTVSPKSCMFRASLFQGLSERVSAPRSSSPSPCMMGGGVVVAAESAQVAEARLSAE